MRNSTGVPPQAGSGCQPTASAASSTASSQSGIPNAGKLFVAPWAPTEKMWGGLARSIMMWLDFGPRHTPASLLKHLDRTGIEIPQWLRDEPEMQSADHSMSKGTRCVLIYRAMLWDGRAQHLTPSGHTPDCEFHCEQYPSECTCGVSWLPAPVRVALAASAIDARQRPDREAGLDPKGESAVPEGQTPQQSTPGGSHG